MREWRVNMSRYGIDREAYRELKAFCHQYPDKKDMVASAIMPAASEHVGSGRGLPSDPVSRAAIEREIFLRDIEMIERAARETDGGKWERALLRNACYKEGYERLDPSMLPTCNRNAFFSARREFFWRLYNLKIWYAWGSKNVLK